MSSLYPVFLAPLVQIVQSLRGVLALAAEQSLGALVNLMKNIFFFTICLQKVMQLQAFTVP
jgi:hypothetical protein